MKFASDEAALKWVEGEKVNDDPYGKAIYAYAQRWAELMEQRLETARREDSLINVNAMTNNPPMPMDDLAFTEMMNLTSHEADTDHLTGFMVGAAAATLSYTWVYGERLRVAWNALNGVKAEKDTVNPAIVTMTVRDP